MRDVLPAWFRPTSVTLNYVFRCANSDSAVRSLFERSSMKSVSHEMNVYLSMPLYAADAKEEAGRASDAREL